MFFKEGIGYQIYFVIMAWAMGMRISSCNEKIVAKNAVLREKRYRINHTPSRNAMI